MDKQLSADEKQEALFQRWLSPKDPMGNAIPFQSLEAERAYQARINRLRDAIRMEKTPDRVPVIVAPSFYPVY